MKGPAFVRANVISELTAYWEYKLLTMLKISVNRCFPAAVNSFTSLLNVGRHLLGCKLNALGMPAFLIKALERGVLPDICDERNRSLRLHYADMIHHPSASS
jgi:hypothetical protein